MTDAFEAQAARAVLMVRPARFGSNPETAPSNAYQGPIEGDLAQGALRAQEEFDGLVVRLAETGVRVHVFDDDPTPEKPDALFPNNWLTTHADGTLILYPLLAPNRRSERRPEIVAALSESYVVSNVVDLTGYEREGAYLEGTGSLVLDRVHRIAYACNSPRTSPRPLAEFGRRMGYRIVAFDALDEQDRAIYHTNVMLSVGTHFALVCAEALPEASERERLLRTLQATRREILEISRAQVAEFLGNVLELRGDRNQAVIALSRRAEAALTREQRTRLEAHGRLVSAPLDGIERAAGGSARCMLAEIHLPRR